MQTAWRVLIAGFGGLLLMMALAGVDALRVMRQIRASNAEIRRAYLTRNRALEQIRAGIYLSGTAVRDYLLSMTPNEADESRQKYEEVRVETDAAVRTYAATLDPREVGEFSSLRGEIIAYWRLLEIIFEGYADVRLRGGRYFYNQLAVRRSAMLELADRISAVNERELAAGDERVSAIFDRFRVRQILIFVLTVGGGLGLACATIFYTLRLEGQVRQRYEESVRAQNQLKELSARLVAAQEDERRAIARELHDEVGQSLTALLMDAGTAAALASHDSNGLRERLESIKQLAEHSVNAVRNMALLLRPSMLDDLGLVPALRWQAREVSKRTGLKVRITAEGVPDDLPDEHKTCIYRVVQEALNNCARHAHAHTVRVQVIGQPSAITLSIQDDGAGFDVKQVRGLGLLGMEERLTHIGGHLKIVSEPGKGAVLTADLPVPNHHDA